MRVPLYVHENSYMRTTFHRTYSGLYYKKKKNRIEIGPKIKKGVSKWGYQKYKRGYKIIPKWGEIILYLLPTIHPA